MQRVAIVGGKRTPFVKANTAFKDLDAIDLGRHAVQAALDGFDFSAGPVDELIYGTVIQNSRVSNLAREVLFATSLPRTVPAYSVIRACATGMQAVTDAASHIALGSSRSALAGGSESLSDLPVAYPRSMAEKLLALKAAKTARQRLGILASLRWQDVKPQVPAIAELLTGRTMGEHCEDMAKEWGITRAEQDALALASHQNTARAWSSGLLADQVVSVSGCHGDNLVRPDTSMEKLAKLAPVFDRSERGTLTAGNSSPLTDGASVVLLASEEEAKRRNWPILAFLETWTYAAIDPTREGLLMAPAHAIPRVLDQAGLTVADIDRFEIHEAFAAQVLCTLKALASEAFAREKLGRNAPLGEIPREKLNVQGGSIATGHPFGATGGRLVTGLAHMLARENLRYGLISICAAGGLGVAAILKRA